MHPFTFFRFAGVFAVVLSIAGICAPARANDKLDVEISPVYWVNAAGDANAPAPAGTVPLGYNSSNPATHDWVLDYGTTYSFNRRLKAYYSHEVLDFQIDRILMPLKPGVTASMISGDISDRIDKLGTSYAVSRTLAARAFFLDHERSYISGLCMNQITCNGKHNPNVADMHGYGVGGTYAFGPVTSIGRLFVTSLDAEYIPRPAFPPVPTDKPSANGMGSWVGSMMLYPYSLGMALPLGDRSLVGTVAYVRSAEFFRNQDTQALYNVMTVGLTKKLTPDLSVSLTNLNYKECRCSDTVAPPDNLRAAGVAMKFSYKFPSAKPLVRH